MESFCQPSIGAPDWRCPKMILGFQVGKDRQVNYHASLTIPYGLYKFSATHSHHQYQQFLEGASCAPWLIMAPADKLNWIVSRLLHRDGNQKTAGYIKVNHKRSSNYIDDVNLEVQTAAQQDITLASLISIIFTKVVICMPTWIISKEQALKAKPAPEEHIYDAFRQQPPSEGFAKAPIWSLYTSFQKPFDVKQPKWYWTKRKIKQQQINPFTSIPLTYTARFTTQYAKQLPVPSDLFYLGGRYSIKRH